MPGLPRRKDLQRAQGVATTAGGIRPAGCLQSGGEQHEERAEA